MRADLAAALIHNPKIIYLDEPTIGLDVVVKENVRKAIKEINEKYDGKHIVLVTHSLCARIMLLSFLDSSVQNIYRINQGNTALNIIELRDYGPVVMKMNDTTHIINDTKLENSALE